MTKEKDIVLIKVEDKVSNFARIERITTDSKLGWFKVKLMLLQIPLLVITWILKENYINGDKFTIEGQVVQLEKVICPDDALEYKRDTIHNNVISMHDYYKQ